MFLNPSKCVYFPRWGAYFSSAPLNFDQVFERECFFSKGVFAGGDIPRGVLQKMGPMHLHRVLHCFLAARMCCFSSVGRTIWIFCATSRIIMRFLLILASGGVGRIFFTRRGQIAAPGLDSVLLAAPGGSWAGFYAFWRLLGGDSGFLAASVLDFVLVAASGLDSGLGSGFLAASRLDSGLLAACSCRGMALLLTYVSSDKKVL